MGALDRWYRLAERAVLAVEDIGLSLRQLASVPTLASAQGEGEADADSEAWVFADEVAELAGLSVSSVRRKMAAGEMPGVEGPWRVQRRVLLRWLDHQQQPRRTDAVPTERSVVLRHPNYRSTNGAGGSPPPIPRQTGPHKAGGGQG